MAQYNKAVIPLSEFCKDYLNITEFTAKRKYSEGNLDLPLFRYEESQKAPLFIRVQDLAEHIDAKAEKAKKQVQALAV